ncbi:hypothetical protein HIM_09251 [Hirsutella minnesotensis 3608]|uniref:Inclusion body clearance protein IML2 n=1 Tax=Hirsutella minnesotensis 3608 TaxID=1043627 RepID=A0A0F7ZSH4_9HYPO|nr:hypothetical protein HIM_09251 [Hirsutella minnesotensis 3608]
MSPLTSWFRSAGGASAAPADTAADADAEAAAHVAKHRDELEDAMKWTALIMNDDIEGASAGLQRGDSAFHSLGAAVTLFMRAMLGNEKVVMAETTAKLAECEARAAADHKKALRHARAFGEHRVYPPGTEYDLVRAQAQLLSAIVSVMHESLVEAMRGFYRLRKAFIILDGIAAIESKAAAASSVLSIASSASDALEPELNKTPASADNDDDANSTSDSDVFVDAKDDPAGIASPADGSGTSSATTPESDGDDSLPENAPAPLRLKSQSFVGESHLQMEDPIDKYIQSGTNQFFGLLLLILSLTPPAFSRILSVVGFRGDRAKGVRLLWRSASHQNVHGALAGMMLLGYYNGLLGAVDIVPHEADYDEDAECVGPPRERCARLLADMRERYPKSQLWQVEEARLLASQRRLGEALELARNAQKSQMKQLAALQDFELAIYGMTALDWPLMRDTFLRCQEHSDWSPAILVDAVGVSPALEMSYIWSGHKRMGPAEVERVIDTLSWDRCTAGKEIVESIKAEEDEMALWAVNVAVMLRTQGKYDEARSLLEEKVLSLDRSVFKGPTKEDYVVPAATHEMAALAWAECCSPPADVTGSGAEGLAAWRRRKADECQAELDKAKTWEPFALDARLGMRVQCGSETLQWFRRKLDREAAR